MTIEFWGAPQIGSPGLLTRSLEVNIVEYLKWCFLQMGAYQNILYTKTAIPSTGISPAVLKLVDDPNFTAGKVWESRRTNWVWEQGINQATQPLTPAIYIGGVLQTTGYTIDYNNGRVLFTSAKPLTSVVKASYTFRNIQVYNSSQNWVRELDTISMDNTDIRIATETGEGGDLEILGSRRAQMPLVVVRPIFNYRGTEYENGNYTMRVSQDFLLSVISQTPWETQMVHDVLVSCDGKNLPTFNINTAPATFESDGSLAAGGLNFPTLCASYPYKSLWVKSAKSANYVNSGALHSLDVIFNIETIN